MRYANPILILCAGSFFMACNWHPPSNNEGLADSMSTNDSLTAKTDSAILKIDTLRNDSVKIDNTRNADTNFILKKTTTKIDIKNSTPEEVVNFANTLVGTPYVYASINPKVGFDCSGFITYVFNHFGVIVPRSSIEFTTVGNEIPVANAKRGDIILFTGTNPQERFVGHMGLILSNSDTLRFIHSSSGKAMGVTTTPLNKYYQARFLKTIRIFPQNDK